MLIDIRNGVRILTRAGYEAAIKKYLDEAKLEQAAAVRHLRAVHYRDLALKRFDGGAVKYGPLDLDGRDWEREAMEEDIDGLAYRIVRRVKLFGV